MFARSIFEVGTNVELFLATRDLRGTVIGTSPTSFLQEIAVQIWACEQRQTNGLGGDAGEYGRETQQQYVAASAPPASVETHENGGPGKSTGKQASLRIGEV